MFFFLFGTSARSAVFYHLEALPAATLEVAAHGQAMQRGQLHRLCCMCRRPLPSASLNVSGVTTFFF